MNLQLDLQTFKFNARGTSTGVIYLQLKEDAFPDDRWNDFVDVILGWWNEGLAQLLSTREIGLYEFYFMDGPYKWVVDYEGDDDEVAIQCLRHDEVEFFTKLPLTEIVGAVFQQSSELLRLCTQNNWSNDDIKHLEKHFKRLQNLKDITH